MLVVQERRAEPLGQAAVQRLLADMAERRVTEVVPEPDRLDQILVEPQRAGDGARDLGHLERVREPRAVVVAGRGDEHLRLVLEPAERLAVDDPIAVALERRAQPAVGLGPWPLGGIGARCQRRELALLAGADALCESRGDGSGRMLVSGGNGLIAHAAILTEVMPPAAAGANAPARGARPSR